MTTQVRYWNFLDNDDTADINRWWLGIIPKGVYYGFDGVLGADLNLTLTQSVTGQYETQSNNVQYPNKIGKLLTPQGMVVAVDGDLSLPIDAQAAGVNNRIDVIVATAEYVEIQGGSEVLFTVIKGTAAPSPVAPALPFPEKQIKIGELYIPQGTTTALNAGGVVFTKSPYLFLGNRPDNFAYLDRAQNLDYIQNFSRIGFREWSAAVYDDGLGTLTVNEDRILHDMNETAGWEFESLLPETDNTRIMFVRFATDGTLLPSGNLKLPGNVSYTVKGGDMHTFFYYDDGDTEQYWQLMIQQDYAILSKKNQFLGMLSLGPTASATYNATGNKLSLTDTANYFSYVPLSTTTIDQIETKPAVTEIHISNLGISNMNFRVNQSVDTGFTKIGTLTSEVVIIVRPGEYIRLALQGTGWYRVSDANLLSRRMFIRVNKVVN